MITRAVKPFLVQCYISIFPENVRQWTKMGLSKLKLSDYYVGQCKTNQLHAFFISNGFFPTQDQCCLTF